MVARAGEVDREFNTEITENELSEKESMELLWNRALSGEVEPFADLSNNYLEQIYRYIFYQVKDRTTAEELVTEIFLEAYKRLSSYKDKTDFSLWLFRIAYDYMLEDPRFVSTLPFVEKQIVLFRFVQGLEIHDISLIIRKSESQIKFTQTRALYSLIANKPTSSKLDKALADILETSLMRISSGESIERSLFKYSKYRDQLEPLLRIGLQIASNSKITPEVEFQNGFRSNLEKRLKQLPARTLDLKLLKTRSKSTAENRDLSESKESKSSIFSALAGKVHSLNRPPQRPEALPEPISPDLEEIDETTQGITPVPNVGVFQKLTSVFRGSKILTIACAVILLVIISAVLLLSGAVGMISSLVPKSSDCILSISSGSVEIQAVGDKVWQKATDNTELKAGTRIRTLESSRAELRFEDGSRIYLDPVTEIEITQAKIKSDGPVNIALKQNNGSSTSQVVKLASTDSTFEIETPSALISVKGTRFTSRVDAKGTTVVVDEGSVAVSAQGKEVLVRAGYQLNVEKGKAPGEPSQNKSSNQPDSTTAATPTPTASAIPNYAVTTKNTTGGSVAQPVKATGSYPSGAVLELVAVPQSGYYFSGWTGDIANISDPKAASTNITIKSNCSITANFVKAYILTIRTIGGSILQPGESVHEYPAGAVVNLSVKPDSGYVFVNWTGDVSAIADPKSTQTTITIKANANITANFIRVHKLTVNSAPGGYVVKPGEGNFTFEDRTSVPLLAVPDKDYLFGGWTCDTNVIADPVAASTTILMIKDITITPKFVKVAKIYSLTTKVGTGGSVELPGQDVYTCKENTPVDLVALPFAGYGFLRWTGDTATVADIYSAATTITMKGNYTVTANFIRTYTLTMNTSAGGVAPGTVTYIYNTGSIVPINAKASEGYVFTQWTGDITNVADRKASNTTVLITANTSITANFARLNTLVLSASVGGTTSQSGEGSYQQGTVVNITAVANAGYHFVNWSGDTANIADIHDPITTVTVGTNTNITANFVLNEYVLTLNNIGTGSGTITWNPNRSTYHYGEQVTLNAQPSQGSQFVGFSSNVINNIVTITENTVVTATFNLTEYAMIINVNPQNGGTVNVDISGPYHYGDIIQITAVANSGWTFNGWSGDAGGSEHQVSITIDGNKTVTAGFTQA